jgi:hypothetical protein
VMLSLIAVQRVRIFASLGGDEALRREIARRDAQKRR